MDDEWEELEELLVAISLFLVCLLPVAMLALWERTEEATEKAVQNGPTMDDLYGEFGFAIFIATLCLDISLFLRAPHHPYLLAACGSSFLALGIVTVELSAFWDRMPYARGRNKTLDSKCPLPSRGDASGQLAVAVEKPSAAVGAETLGPDTLSTVMSFLSWKDVSRARLVNRNWRQNAPSIPLYRIKNRNSALALKRASPFSKRISRIFCGIHRGDPLNFAKGKDSLPEPRSHRQARAPRPIDLEACIANVEGLRELTLFGTNLNGFYPFLVQFRRLRVLVLSENYDLKWDLSTLANLPMLEVLHCKYNTHLTGNLRDVRALQSGLKQLDLSACGKIEGSLHDLADFPCLEVLCVLATKITGDVRNIRESDFPALEICKLGQSAIYGGGYYVDRITDVAPIIQGRYRLKKRMLKPNDNFAALKLSNESPDRYLHEREPPFWVEFVVAGPRLGWRWTNLDLGGACETNWFDPEPQPSDADYDRYAEALANVEGNVYYFQGFRSPPTLDQYLLL